MSIAKTPASLLEHTLYLRRSSLQYHFNIRRWYRAGHASSSEAYVPAHQVHAYDVSDRVWVLITNETTRKAC
jgi:hypothetical protein